MGTTPEKSPPAAGCVRGRVLNLPWAVQTSMRANFFRGGRDRYCVGVHVRYFFSENIHYCESYDHIKREGQLWDSRRALLALASLGFLGGRMPLRGLGGLRPPRGWRLTPP
jgi:hypothetical protein